MNNLSNDVRSETVTYSGLLHRHRDIVAALRRLDSTIETHETALATAREKRQRVIEDYRALLEAIESERKRLAIASPDLSPALALLDAHHEFDNRYDIPADEEPNDE